MDNFDEKDQNAVAKFILANLGRHKQFALGTADGNHPWVVCLNLTYDKNINVIWKSRIDTEHSKHIRFNPNVSICVFSEDDKIGDFGIYANAVAHEIMDPKELADCLDVRFRQKGKAIPDASEYLIPSEYRLYSANISEMWVNDKRHLKMKVDMGVLRQVAQG